MVYSLPFLPSGWCAGLSSDLTTTLQEGNWPKTTNSQTQCPKYARLSSVPHGEWTRMLAQHSTNLPEAVVRFMGYNSHGVQQEWEEERGGAMGIFHILCPRSDNGHASRARKMLCQQQSWHWGSKPIGHHSIHMAQPPLFLWGRGHETLVVGATAHRISL